MDISNLTAVELGAKIKAGELTVKEAVEAALESIEQKDGGINAYITVLKEEALARAEEVQQGIDSGKYTSPARGSTDRDKGQHLDEGYKDYLRVEDTRRFQAAV